MTAEDCTTKMMPWSLKKSTSGIVLAASFITLLLTGALPKAAAAEDWVIGDANAMPSQIVDDPGPEYSFSIPPQPLEIALEAFGATTGLQLLYNSRLTSGVNSPGVTGRFDATTALGRLLAGSNLTTVRTAHNVMTFVMSSQNIQVTAAPPTKAPLLQLGALHVDAPLLDDEHVLYAASVRYAVQNALLSTKDARISNYRIDVNVWITPAGIISKFQLLSPTGDARADQAIARAISSIAIGHAPPVDLPQPVHINILAVRNG